MPLRVVIGEDDVLLREGISRILEGAGLDVVAQTGDAEDFLRRARAHRPDVAIVDVQMPPNNEDDGLRAALELRSERPETGVLVLSQHFEESYAVDLIGDRVAQGGTALDSEIVARMLGRRRVSGPLDELTPRERDVLREMAEGKSNRGIAEALVVSDAAVEKHVTSIFRKLGIESAATDHRRVLAVLRYVRASRV
jgi:DNA-binding NarL/FixJ family response regulator